MNAYMVGLISATAVALLCPSAVDAGPFDNAVGDWRGQAGYVAKGNAIADDTAHAVV